LSGLTNATVSTNSAIWNSGTGKATPLGIATDSINTREEEMSDGGWVALGAAIGAAGSILTTFLNAWLNKKAPDKYETAASKLLKEMLEKGDTWRSLPILANVIGADHQDTKEMLLMLGARASETNPLLWGLVSRNPLPDRVSA
jgi:hypothetical protein